MNLLSIDDLDLQSINLHEPPSVIAEGSISMEFAARRREGELGSMFVSGAPDTSRWVVLFKPDDHEARDAILAAIVSDMTGERRLLAERLDVNQTRVVADASVAYIEQRNEFDFLVAFEGSDSVWRAEAETATSKTFDSAADLALHVAVPGNARTYPVLRITPQTQRTASSIYAGWTWRRRYRIANNGDVPWFRHPVRIALGDTTGLTTTKAQADGDDLRVWLHGIEQPRTLVTWDTATSFVWVLVPNLPEGESLDFDIVYGNPSATSPPLLAYPDVSAFELASSANDSLVWRSDPDDVADVGEGLYFISETTWPFSADYGTPGSWRPVITLQDDETPDVSGVTNATFREAQGENAWASMSIIRIPADIEIFEQIQWRINGYDGMAFSWPLPIEAITATMSTALSSVAAESIVLLCRESSADPWSLATSTSPGADLTLSSFNLFRPMRHIALALWPHPPDQRTKLDASLFAEGDSVAAALTTDVTVEIDDTDLAITLIEAETEIYELAGEARIGGGSSRQAPYHAVLLGNARQETGAGTPRLAVKLGNTLEVNCETHEHIEYDAAGAFVERASAHAIHGVQAWDLDGVAQEVGAVEWLPLSPGKTVVPNGAFAAGIGGWEADGADAGITVARTWAQPAHPWTPLDLGPALLGWFRGSDLALAGGAQITDWDDAGPNDWDATGSAGSTRPTYDAADEAADFERGSSQFLDTLELSASSLDRTIAAVIDLEDTSVNSTILGASATGGLSFRVSSSNTLQFNKQGAAAMGSTSGTVSGTGYQVVRGTAGATTWALSINGTEETGAHAQTLTAALTAHVGKGHTGEFFDGKMKEVVVTTALSQADAQRLDGYLAWTHGIQGNLSGGHPYASAAPTVGGLVAQALSMDITASSGAASATARTLSATLFGVNARQAVDVAATVRSDDANLSPQLAVRFYDASEANVATEAGALNYGVVDTPFRTALAAPVPPNATQFRIGLWVRDQVGSTTGEVWFDDVTCNDADVMFADDSIGGVAVAVGVKGAFLT